MPLSLRTDRSSIGKPVLQPMVQNASHKAVRSMAIPTEPIGSIPRVPQLIDAGHDLAAGQITGED